MNEHLLLVLELLKPWLQTNAPVHNMQDMVTTKKDCDIKCNIHPTQKLAASVQTLPLLAVELYTPKLLSVLRKKAIYGEKKTVLATVGQLMNIQAKLAKHLKYPSLLSSNFSKCVSCLLGTSIGCVKQIY